MWEVLRGFLILITYNTMHFKQFQDDLVKKKMEKIGVGISLA